MLDLMEAPHRESNEAVAERLELLRVALGFQTQAEFARAINRSGNVVMTPQRWSNYLRGVALIPVEVVRELHRRWGVDANYVYHGDPGGLQHKLVERLDAAKS